MNLKLITVDLGVECLYVSRDLWGTPAERVERQPDDSFTSSAHRKQVGLQLAKLGEAFRPLPERSAELDLNTRCSSANLLQ